MKKYRIAIIILFALGLVFWGMYAVKKLYTAKPAVEARNNPECKETYRVFDYADVLSSADETKLEEDIAAMEKEIGCDIAIITINDEKAYSYDGVKMKAADALDEYAFGWDEAYGSCVIFVDNWYGPEGSRYCFLLTSGSVRQYLTDSDAENIINQMYSGFDTSPMACYERMVSLVGKNATTMSSGYDVDVPWWVSLVIGIIAAGIFAGVNLYNSKGKKETDKATYVKGGSAVEKVHKDVYLRTTTTRHYSPQNKSSGGGGISSGGHSFGGAGGRH